MYAAISIILNWLRYENSLEDSESEFVPRPCGINLNIGKVLYTHTGISVEFQRRQGSTGGCVGVALRRCDSAHHVQRPVGRVARRVPRTGRQKFDGRLRRFRAVGAHAVLLQLTLALVHHVRLQQEQQTTRFNDDILQQ
jgi:hypothetical protein